MNFTCVAGASQQQQQQAATGRLHDIRVHGLRTRRFKSAMALNLCFFVVPLQAALAAPYAL